MRAMGVASGLKVGGPIFLDPPTSKVGGPKKIV